MNNAHSRSVSNIRQSGSDPLGIPYQLCYKPAKRLSGSLEGCSHDDAATFNILRAIDPGGNLLQPGHNRMPLTHHVESRGDTYDQAITDAISKQLLINIARAHQHQPIHFTGVSNIAATFDFRVSAGATPALTGEASRALMPIFGGSVAENPTISIVPIEGEEFTKRLLTPFQETKFLLLLRQRYDIDLLLRLMAQELRITENGQDVAYRNSPADRTGYEMFRRVVTAPFGHSRPEPSPCRTARPQSDLDHSRQFGHSRRFSGITERVSRHLQSERQQLHPSKTNHGTNSHHQL